MVTSKLVTNIFYGKEQGLLDSLRSLVEDGKIAWWCYCVHRGERSFNLVKHEWVGQRLKNHIHVGIKPNCRLDLDVVYNNCLQIESATKTVGFTRNWVYVRSNFDFWLYLYHDRDYCDTKGLIREYYYTEKDVICSDDDIKAYELYRAKEELWASMGVSNEVVACAKGLKSEVSLFSRHLRDAYGVDKMLKAARRELMENENYCKSDEETRSPIRQVGFGL